VSKLHKVWAINGIVGVTGTPAVTGGVAYFDDWTGAVRAVDAATGKSRWTTKLGAGMFVAAPVVTGDAVYVALSNTLYRLDRATGNTMWKVTTDSSPFAQINASPVVVEVKAPPGEQTAAVAGRIRQLPGVAAVGRPQQLGDQPLSLIDVVPRNTSTVSGSAQNVVRDIRALDSPVEVGVTGASAAFVDLKQSIADHLPYALGLLALTTVVVLFLFTGSVILPFKALVMNALSLSAAFGLLVLIFQDGRLEGFLSYVSQGALETTQPVVLFAVAFGLSTDYGVFLLSRIKEARAQGVPDREAVPIGLERTGRIVTAAAILFCVAIGAFATSRIVFIKELGVGTALAVLIDATIVRALLVPSLMALLGRWNWWAPKPLRRLHKRIGLDEAAAPA